MSVCNPAPINLPGGWFTAPTDAWCNWKRRCRKAPGHKHMLPKFTAAAFMDYGGPTKIPKLDHWSLFYLLPMNIINDIDDWIILL